jgi:hypothetical protein
MNSSKIISLQLQLTWQLIFGGINVKNNCEPNKDMSNVIMSPDTLLSLRLMLKYQICGPDKTTIQYICEHETYKFISDFNIQCQLCDHQFDIQHFLLVLPPLHSTCLAEILITEYPPLASILLFRISINIPENPEIFPCVTFNSYHALLRWLGLVVGCFYELTYESTFIDQSDVTYFNQFAKVICYDYNDQYNKLLVENFPKLFTNLLLQKTKDIKNLALSNSNADHNAYLKNLLEMTCTILENIQKETLKVSQNPISYVNNNFIKYYEIIRGEKFIKVPFNCVSEGGMPRKHSYEWFTLFFQLFNKCRAEYSRYVLKLDLVLSIIPLMGIFSAHDIPEYLKHTLAWLENVEDVPQDIDSMLYREKSINPGASIMAALSFPCFWITKMSFCHYDWLFVESFLFKKVERHLSKLIGPRSHKMNKSHCRDYYFKAKELRSLETAPDSSLIGALNKIGSEVTKDIRAEITEIAMNLSLQIDETEIDELMSMVFPYAVFHFDRQYSMTEKTDSFYLFLATYWIQQKTGLDKITGVTLGKYKGKANDLAKKLKTVFKHIRENINCVYEPDNPNIMVTNSNGITQHNVFHFNPLYAANMLSHIQKENVYSDLLYSFINVLKTFPSESFSYNVPNEE